MHDTSRDEFVFYDEHILNEAQVNAYKEHQEVFNKALEINSKERARKFSTLNPKLDSDKTHKQVKRRTVSLFEPRPECRYLSEISFYRSI